MKKIKGFSLPEIVVVMAIISILAVLGIAGISISKRTAMNSTNRSNATSVMVAAEAYYAKHTKKAWIDPDVRDLGGGLTNTCLRLWTNGVGEPNPDNWNWNCPSLKEIATNPAKSYLTNTSDPSKNYQVKVNLEGSCATGKWAGGGQAFSCDMGGEPVYTIYLANDTCDGYLKDSNGQPVKIISGFTN